MQVVYIDLIPQKIKPVVFASQFDDNRMVRFRLTENGEDYTLDGTETVTVTVKKPDGNIVIITPEIDAVNYVDVYFTEQACACYGISFGELEIINNDAKIGTCNFDLDVEISPSFGGIESHSEIDDLTSQIADVVAETVEEVAPAIIEEIAPQVIGDEYLTKAEIEESYYDKTEVYNKNETFTRSEVNDRRPCAKNWQTLTAGDTSVTFNYRKNDNFNWRMFSVYADEPNIMYSDITIEEGAVDVDITITFPESYDHDVKIRLLSFGLAAYTLET